jgi:hypothetical protein
MKLLHPLALLLLVAMASCCGPRGAVEVVIPEHQIEGEATAIDAEPDSLRNPCDSLLAALEPDTLYIHDTVYVRQQQEKAKRAVQAIREQVCLWDDIQYEDSAVVLSIARGQDGAPLYSVRTKERRQAVECNCRDQVKEATRRLRTQRNYLLLLLVIAVLVALVLLRR